MANLVDPSKLVAFMRDDLQLTVADVLEHYYQQATIPATAFEKPLTPLETVCTYLSHHYGHSTKEIAQETGRPYNSVRSALKNARTKAPTPKEDEQTPYRIPVDALRTDLSPAQAIVHHLHAEHGLGSSEIARLIGRDQRNVASVLAAAQRKLRGENA